MTIKPAKKKKKAGVKEQVKKILDQHGNPFEKAAAETKKKEEFEHVRKTLVSKLETATEEERTALSTISFIFKSSLLSDKPKTTQQLFEYLVAAHGVAIPYKSCSEDTQAPMQWASDVYFGRESSTFAIGNRGSGKTYIVALIEDTWGTFSPGATITHSASNLNQAKVAQGYLLNISRDPVLGRRFVPRSVTKKSATWRNGSEWYVVTGNSMAAVSGHHPQKAVWDELEFWDRDALEQTWAVPKDKGMPGTEDYIPRVWAGVSTRQRGFGAANYLTKHAKKKGVKIYRWNVFESMAPCVTCIARDAHPHGTDAQRESVCCLWSRCRGEKAKKSRGFQSLPQVLAEVTPMSEEARATQVFCDKPSSKGVVFGMREEKYRPFGNYTNATYNPDKHYWIWFDPAEGRWSVMYFVQFDAANEVFLIFDELCINPCQSGMVSKVDLYTYIGEKGYDDPLFIVCDPRKTDVIHDFKSGSRYGHGAGRAYNAVHPKIAKEAGGRGVSGQDIVTTLATMQNFVRDGYGLRRLCWNPVACPRFDEAMQEYHYPTDNLGNVKENTDQPAPAYKDFIDPPRYGIQYYTQRPTEHLVEKVRRGSAKYW